MIKRVIVLGEYFFIAGVFFLIIRKNSYPWPVKRASDILFFFSFLTVLFGLYFTSGWQAFLKYTRNTRKTVGVIILCLTFASLVSFLLDGEFLGLSGILAFGRFLEVGALVLAIAFFSNSDPAFLRKVAIAQLSTISYLFVFIIPNELNIAMYRFELFENWPSNVAYSLIVSIGFLAAGMLVSLTPFTKRFFLFYAPAVGLSGIFLWAQSRAGWLGLGIALGATTLLWARKTRWKRVFYALSAFGSLVPIGFLLLSPNIKNNVLSRVFPRELQAAPSVSEETPNAPSKKESGTVVRDENRNVDFYKTNPSDFIKSIIAERRLPSFQEPSRPYLWRAYSKKILERPWGFGAEYTGVVYEGIPRGPHNTLLEVGIMAGVIGIIAYIILLISAFQNIFFKIRESDAGMFSLYLLASLTGLTVASFFDNMSTHRLMWIIIGLALFYAPKRKAAQLSQDFPGFS